MTIKLGSRVRDAVTGFKGTATARIERLFGGPQVLVEAPKLSDGKAETEWFDEARLELAPVDAASCVTVTLTIEPKALELLERMPELLERSVARGLVTPEDAHLLAEALQRSLKVV